MDAHEPSIDVRQAFPGTAMKRIGRKRPDKSGTMPHAWTVGHTNRFAAAVSNATKDDKVAVQ